MKFAIFSINVKQTRRQTLILGIEPKGILYQSKVIL